MAESKAPRLFLSMAFVAFPLLLCAVRREKHGSVVCSTTLSTSTSPEGTEQSGTKLIQNNDNAFGVDCRSDSFENK